MTIKPTAFAHLVLACLTAQSLAQEHFPDRAQGPVIEEITVTAQKRAESLQSVPLAIAAISATDVERLGLMRSDQIGQAVPGLTFEMIGMSRPTTYIRGIGTGSFDAGSDPSVAIFIDEVYVPRYSGAQFEMTDIERIEVLKGPQGTLFGRNAAGGAINVVSKLPSTVPTATVTVAYGNYDSASVKASVSGPLMTDNVTGRLSLLRRSRDGYTKNLASGRRHNDDDVSAVRSDLEIADGDRTWRIKADWSRDRAGAWQNFNLTDNVLLGFPPIVQGLPRASDPRRQYYSTDGFQDRDSASMALRLDWERSLGTLTSISAWSRGKFEELHDLDATLARSVDRYADEDSRMITQEIRFASASQWPWRWVGGIYLFREDVERHDALLIGEDSALVVVLNQGQTYSINDVIDIKSQSYAVFGQATRAVTDRLNVTLGARYSYDDKSATRTASTDATFSPLLPAGGYVVDTNADWDSIDAVATIDYQIADDVMAYGSWRSGYKAGGIQPPTPPTAFAADVTFDPESAKVYELGIKSRALGGRLQFNAVAYYTEYEDIQILTGSTVSQNGAFVTITDNAAKATSKGIELDLTLVPVEWIELRSSYALIHGEYDEYIEPSGQDLSGNRLVRTPRHELQTTLNYRVPIGGRSELALGAVWHYTSRIHYDVFNTPTFSQQPVHRFDARASLRLGEAIQLTAWGRNLTDKAFIQNVINVANGSVGLATIDAPRTFGLSVTWHTAR